MDFSQPYYSTRVGIAVAANPSTTDWSAVFEAVFSWAFLKIILSLLGFLLVAAVAMWLCERQGNDEVTKGEPVSAVSHERVSLVGVGEATLHRCDPVFHSA